MHTDSLCTLRGRKPRWAWPQGACFVVGADQLQSMGYHSQTSPSLTRWENGGCPGSPFRREERGCGPVTGKDRASCQCGGAPALRPGAVALSSALAFPLDLGARPLCRRLRGRGCANCQSLPQTELFVRQRERPGLHSQAVAWPPRLSAGRRESGSQKDSDAGRDWGQEEKGTTEDEMAGWHH